MPVPDPAWSWRLALHAMDLDVSGHDTSAVGSVPWFNVTTYGAVNDDTTDDHTAINAAIAAYNAAGGGVLYFPAGAGYYVSNALTALTAPGLVLGDGRGQSGGGASVIRTDHATAKLFSVSGNFIEFRGLGLINTATTPASGGAGIATTTGKGAVCAYRDLWVQGFYDCLALQHGSRWLLDGCQIVNPSRYGIWIANTDVPDGGDWMLSNTEVTTDSTATHTPTSAIRQDSSGGGKVTNLKINGTATHPFVTGYDLLINGAANNTSILTIASVSVENVSGDAVSLATSGSGTFGLAAISGLQVGLYSNNTGRAVKVNAASTGGFLASGGLGTVVIDGLAAYTDGTARAAVSLTNTDRVSLGDIALQGFNARYTSTGDTNTTDGGSVSFATPAIVLGTAAATGSASTVIRSDSTIVAFDATVPVTQAFSDAAATGSAAVAARRDHKHGMPASPSGGGVGEILISDTPSTPLIFADLIQNEAQTDLVYADP